MNFDQRQRQHRPAKAYGRWRPGLLTSAHMPTFVAEKNYPKSSQIWNAPECFAAKMTRSSSLSIWGFWFQNCAAPRGHQGNRSYCVYAWNTHLSNGLTEKVTRAFRNKPTTVSKSLPSQSTLQWQWGQQDPARSLSQVCGTSGMVANDLDCGKDKHDAPQQKPKSQIEIKWDQCEIS